ncbi:efflux RND transporter periplasmic adaptor subunit [Bosea sp. CCNWLW174]|uniref:HlyD family secretion protein n=1 Tax=unclassified Bosea (in: a-proteobacteria) TaxID=2653178 RepID=UPI000C301507|nr:efflux RND transporter periplasmic adaptor subunit [Bosea sp. FBZP-16]
MMVFLMASYFAILSLFVWLRWIPWSPFWKFSPLLVLVALNLGLFIPMGWGAPSGPVLVARNAVQIVPSVAGEVIDVPVRANATLKQGDVLLRIDPTVYEAQAAALAAQLKFAELRRSQMEALHDRGAGRNFDVEQRQAEVEQLQAQLATAKWNLDKTTVLAPADGYVTNLALRKGARVTAQAPVMAFIDSSETIIGVEIAQIYARYIEVGQPVEVAFKIRPGEVHTGRVEAVLQAIASGQTEVSGRAVLPGDISAAPFVVRIRLDDQVAAMRLPAGSTGTAAIFTDHVKASHMIRRVILRQVAILNYINPF